LTSADPIREPRELDIPMAVSTYEYFAGWADKIEGRTIPTPGYFGQPTPLLHGA